MSTWMQRLLPMEPVFVPPPPTRTLTFCPETSLISSSIVKMLAEINRMPINMSRDADISNTRLLGCTEKGLWGQDGCAPGKKKNVGLHLCTSYG